LIRVQELTAGYGEKQVISCLSFLTDSLSGPLVLAGPNGAGKSTLLKAILNQIPYSGKIDSGQANQSIGWIPQTFQISLSIPVIDFISLGTIKKGVLFSSLPKIAPQLAEQALSDLGLLHLRDKNTDELSGGEWQLVCIAQLMVQETDIWLLDEPTSSLDVYYKSFIFKLLWEKSEMGKTIIISTHDLPFLPITKGNILLFDDQYSLMPISKATIADTIEKLSLLQF